MAPEDFMSAAFGEARKALGRTGPNPCVGALIVRDGRIIARGFHRKAGEAHAEIEALTAATEDVRGADLYVTLEPCRHLGRTGPCCEAVIGAGIKRVFYGCSDPNPAAGGGLARLREAGVIVEGPILEATARELIADFSLGIAERRPWVIAKLACSLDGRIATKTGESKWITSEAARAQGRVLRGQVQAIAAGVGTVLADDPELTARTGGPEPVRVVFDSHGRTPANAKVRGADTLFVSGDVRSVIERLYRERGIMRLLVEGGPTLIGSFADAGLIDELHLFMAPMVFGGAAKNAVDGDGVARIADAKRMTLKSVERIGDDVHAVYFSR